MFELKIFPDEGRTSPAEWGSFGDIYFWHHRYTLTDNDGFDDPDDFLDYHSNATIEELWDLSIPEKEALVRKNHLLLPLYLYDHSGLSLSTTPFSCPWDSGQVGYILISHEDIAINYGCVSAETLAKAEKILKGEVRTWDEYLSGDVYGFELLENGSMIDSCVGFFCNLEAAKEQMREYIPEIHWDMLEQAEVSYNDYI